MALESWIPKPEPNGAQLLAEALVERAIYPREVARGLRRIVRGPRRALRRLTEAALAAGSFASTGLGAPRSPFNFDVGSHRRFAWVRASLARHEARQEPARRHGQRRHPGRRRGGARPLHALPRPPHRRPRAACDGPGERQDRRGARRPRQPRDLDDGSAARLVRGPGAAAGDRARVDGRPEGVEAGAGRLAAHPARRLRATDHRRAGGAPAVAAALLQPRGHQHPGPAVPAVPDGSPDGAGLPDGSAGQEPGRLHRGHELRRAGQLRADRRLRRIARPRRPRHGTGGLDRRADRGGRWPPRVLPAVRGRARESTLPPRTAAASARNRQRAR